MQFPQESQFQTLVQRRMLDVIRATGQPSKRVFEALTSYCIHGHTAPLRRLGIFVKEIPGKFWEHDIANRRDRAFLDATERVDGCFEAWQGTTAAQIEVLGVAANQFWDAFRAPFVRWLERFVAWLARITPAGGSHNGW